MRSVSNIGQDDPNLVVPSESEIQTINTAQNENTQALSNGLSKVNSNIQARSQPNQPRHGEMESERSNPGLSKRSDDESSQAQGLKH